MKHNDECKLHMVRTWFNPDTRRLTCPCCGIELLLGKNVEESQVEEMLKAGLMDHHKALPNSEELDKSFKKLEDIIRKIMDKDI